MSSRVLIQRGVRSVMRVSLPGYDVFTAPLTGIAFDASYGRLAVVKKGIIQFPTAIGQARSVSVSFDEYQVRPPFCLCWFKNSALGDTSTPAFTPNRYMITTAPIEHNYWDVNVSRSGATFSTHSASGQYVGYLFLRQLDAA